MSHLASSVIQQPLNFDPARVSTPAFVVDLSLLKQNLELLAQVQHEAGCKVLLALKGFAMFSTFPLVRQYLSGCCASGLNEALLAHEEFGKQVHVYSPAFKDEEMRQIMPIADHISFNSLRQWQKFRPVFTGSAATLGGEEKKTAAKGGGAPLHAPSPGLRVNPEVSTVEVALYDPCSPGCRLGVRASELEGADLSGLEGLHFHALCEQGADVLEKVLEAVEKNFAPFLAQVKWVNMGGGHHITKPGYDVVRLVSLVKKFQERHGVEVYLEPGEAIGLNTGYLVASVLDIVGGAADLPLAQSHKNATITNETHEPHRTHLVGTRSAPDARRAAEALSQRLEETARSAAGADAAQRIHAETECLREWSEQHGWLISTGEISALTSESVEFEGGSEHDVHVLAGTGRVLKLTHPPNFGARGEARLYLQNLLLTNVMFADDWRFEGVVAAPDGVRIVTSQPFIEGRCATEDEIAGYFAALGFMRQREHTFVREDGLMVADARPANILCDSNGCLIPIDVHVLAQAAVVEEILHAHSDEDASPLPAAILDISATCHMPDVLEMPYRPHIIGSGKPGEFAYTFKLGGTSCLAGDVIGEYSFPEPLELGQKLVFTDMAHYTMVKTTTFNGVPHPDIVTYDPATDELRVVRRFGYEDFRNKLS